jgi:hypothetical protein
VRATRELARRPSSASRLPCSSSKVFVSYQLATPGRPVAPTLTGFVCSPGFLNERSTCCAYWVSAKPQPLSLNADPKIDAPRLSLGAAGRPPRVVLAHNPGPLSSLDSTLRVSPIRHHHSTLSRRFCGPRSLCFSYAVACGPFRGLVPFSVFPAARSYRSPPIPTGGPVSSSGFRTLSTLCSPHDLLGLFHPNPAHGVLPSRLCSPRGAVRPFERRLPPDFPCSPALRATRRPSRDCAHRPEPEPPVLGFSQNSTSVPPWAFNLRGLLVVIACSRYDPPASPHALPRPGLRVTRPPAPQGLQLSPPQPVSLETDATSVEFLTSSTLSLLWDSLPPGARKLRLAPR